MKKPNLFVVGAPKTGTSALHDFLSQHPDIFMSHPKELRFFCKDLIKEHDDFYRQNGPLLKRNAYYPIRTEEDYLGAFANRKEEAIAGESSPSYLFSRDAATEIRKFNPLAKIVVIVRDPVDLLYSWHGHVLASGHETVEDIEGALSRESERKRGRQIAKYSLLAQPSMLFYSERVKQSEQIQRYFDAFERKNVKVIVYDDFRENNAELYKDTLDFLGVDNTFVPVFRQVNISRQTKFRRLTILLESSFFVKYVWSIPRLIMPETWYSRMRALLYFRVLPRAKARPPMNPQLRRRLTNQYKPEVERLSQLLGRDLVSLWGYGDVG